MKGAELACAALRELGVTFIAGMPGTDNLAMYDLFERYGIRPIVVRNEIYSTMFADGYSRVSRKYGAVISIPGPGALAMLSGLNEAYYSSIPMVAVVTDIPTEYLNQDRGHLHECMHLEQVFDYVTKRQFLIRDAQSIPAAIRSIAHEQSVRRSPHLFHIPADIYTQEGGEYPAPQQRATVRRMAAGSADRVIDALKKAQRPMIFAGAGVWWADAMEPLRILAEKLNAPVFTSVKGKGVISDNHPLSFGQYSGEPEVAARIAESDCVLGIGTRWSQRSTDKWTLPLPQQLYEINAAAEEFGRNYPSIGGVFGDIAQILKEIAKECPASTDTTWIESVTRARRGAVKRLEATHPFEWNVLTRLRAAIPEDAIVVNDSGGITYYTRRYFPVTHPGTFLWPMGSGAIGWALPAALGAKLAIQEEGTNRPVVALMGDGGLQWSLQELGTMVQEKLPITIVLFDNSSYGTIGHFQKKRHGKETEAVALKNPRFEKLAEAYGIQYRYAPTTQEMEDAIRDSVYLNEATLIHCPMHFTPFTRL
ncbi:MAG: thiamine pyrophosphate-binding protein [Parcubacteria group bacterium]|nr:thiamine pyrophosphate-binding protein [Parcubacteria group bacterium]